LQTAYSVPNFLLLFLYAIISLLISFSFCNGLLLVSVFNINLLKPIVNYSGRTAPLTSKVAFYIQVLNILNMVYILRFFLFKMQFVS